MLTSRSFSRLSMSDSLPQLTINAATADLDTVFHGTSNNLLFLDASANRVGILINNPTVPLEVGGDISCQANTIHARNLQTESTSGILAIKGIRSGAGANAIILQTKNAAGTLIDRISMTGTINTSNILFSNCNIEIDGDLNHDGTNIGLYSATPVSQAAHIIDADGNLADITTKFNALLAALDADAGVGLLAGA